MEGLVVHETQEALKLVQLLIICASPKSSILLQSQMGPASDSQAATWQL